MSFAVTSRASTAPRYWSSLAKRGFDWAAATLGIILISPLLAVVGLAILATMGRPIFFIQERVGMNDRLFRVIKFRTMTEPREFGDDKVTDIERAKTDAQRLTRLGAWLRRTSLDELPQLFNVVRGEMSLVGPRPLLAAYLDRYTARQRRRHEVRPGITGLAQVSGRNSLSWEEKFEFDVRYVETQSFGLDLELLIRTVRVVLTGSGVEAKGSVTPTPFVGVANTSRPSPELAVEISVDEAADASTPAAVEATAARLQAPRVQVTPGHRVAALPRPVAARRRAQTAGASQPAA